MARWAWIAFAALGCSSRTGLAIDVDLAGAASAELLAPVKPCADCAAGIAPPNAQQPLVGRGGSGDVTYLDSPTRQLAVADKTGHAHFELQAGATDPIPKLVIVGFDANDNATGTYVELDDVSVPRTSAAVWDVKLGHPPAGEELFAWRQPMAPCNGSPTHASCVGLQDTSDGSTRFYVPGDDPDCDGCTGSADCNHFWYLDTETDAPCFTDRMTAGSQASVCEAGIGTCTDGAGPAQMSCAAISDTVCVPSAVCGGATCFDGISGCLTPTPVPQSYMMLSCSLLADTTDLGNGEIAMTPCAGSAGYDSIGLPVLTKCTDAGFAQVITSLSAIAFTPSWTITSPMLDTTMSDATLSVDATAISNCVLALSWTGMLVMAASQVTPALDPPYVVVAVDPLTQLVFPISLSVDTTGCSTGIAPIHCVLVPNMDTVFDCGM